MLVESSRKKDEALLFKTQTRNTIQFEAANLIRRLLTLTDNFPALPENRFIIMRLAYRPGTPADYDPEGFEPSSGA